MTDFAGATQYAISGANPTIVASRNRGHPSVLSVSFVVAHYSKESFLSRFTFHAVLPGLRTSLVAALGLAGCAQETVGSAALDNQGSALKVLELHGS